MNLLRTVGVVVVGILLLMLVVGLFLPSKHHLERHVTINAPVSTVFKEVNNLTNWKNWSPWQDMDDDASLRYEGPRAGVGSTMIWDSANPRIGKGSQTIVVSEPNRRIVVQLDLGGWDVDVSAGWQFEEQSANKTKVTWTNDSDNRGKLFSKYMDLFIYPALGKSYEEGLQNLKAHVERTYNAQENAWLGEG
jgi:uncharacterized protein YndB with AHSA1/START domain